MERFRLETDEKRESEGCQVSDYMGNSIQHWYAKATAYKAIVGHVCDAFRSLGYEGSMGDTDTLPARLETFASSLRATRDKLRGALEEIAKGEGPFSRDPLTHASNTIDAMKELARAALHAPPCGETEESQRRMV